MQFPQLAVNSLIGGVCKLWGVVIDVLEQDGEYCLIHKETITDRHLQQPATEVRVQVKVQHRGGHQHIPGEWVCGVC